MGKRNGEAGGRGRGEERKLRNWITWPGFIERRDWIDLEKVRGWGLTWGRGRHGCAGRWRAWRSRSSCSWAGISRGRKRMMERLGRLGSGMAWCWMDFLGLEWNFELGWWNLIFWLDSGLVRMLLCYVLSAGYNCFFLFLLLVLLRKLLMLQMLDAYKKLKKYLVFIQKFWKIIYC